MLHTAAHLQRFTIQLIPRRGVSHGEKQKVPPGDLHLWSDEITAKLLAEEKRLAGIKKPTLIRGKVNADRVDVVWCHMSVEMFYQVHRWPSHHLNLSFLSIEVFKHLKCWCHRHILSLQTGLDGSTRPIEEGWKACAGDIIWSRSSCSSQCVYETHTKKHFVIPQRTEGFKVQHFSPAENC